MLITITAEANGKVENKLALNEDRIVQLNVEIKTEGRDYEQI